MGTYDFGRTSGAASSATRLAIQEARDAAPLKFIDELGRSSAAELRLMHDSMARGRGLQVRGQQTEAPPHRPETLDHARLRADFSTHERFQSIFSRHVSANDPMRAQEQGACV